VIDVPSQSGTTSTTSATLAFDASTKTYEPAVLERSSRERIEKANALFRIRASGAGIPAFDVDLPSAFDAQLLAPAEDAIVTKETGDLVVRWSDGGNDAMFVLLQVIDTTISCSFPVSAGEGVIPGALVKEAFEQSDGVACVGPCVNIGLSVLRKSTVSAGDYDIFVSHALMSFRPLRSE
jgi:hypothetical protein